MVTGERYLRKQHIHRKVDLKHVHVIVAHDLEEIVVLVFLQGARVVGVGGVSPIGQGGRLYIGIA